MFILKYMYPFPHQQAQWASLPYIYSQVHLIWKAMHISICKNTPEPLQPLLQRGATAPDKTNHPDRCEFTFWPLSATHTPKQHWSLCFWYLWRTNAFWWSPSSSPGRGWGGAGAAGRAPRGATRSGRRRSSPGTGRSSRCARGCTACERPCCASARSPPSAWTCQEHLVRPL